MPIVSENAKLLKLISADPEPLEAVNPELFSPQVKSYRVTG